MGKTYALVRLKLVLFHTRIKTADNVRSLITYIFLFHEAILFKLYSSQKGTKYLFMDLQTFESCVR